ncbi:MAG: ATP-binding protein [Patescibacteria group bacterium]
MKKIKQYPNVFFAAATNNVDAIVPELRSAKRLPLKLEITLPGEVERVEIIEHLTIKKRLADLEDGDIESMVRLTTQNSVINYQALAQVTDGFSAGDIKCVIDTANRRRLLAAISADDEDFQNLLTQQEILEAINYTRRTKA